MRARFLKLQLGLWVGGLAGGLGAWLGGGGETYGAVAGMLWGATSTLTRGAEQPGLRRWAVCSAMLLGGLPGGLLSGPAGALGGALLLLHAAALSGQVEAFVGAALVLALPVAGLSCLLIILLSRLDLVLPAIGTGVVLSGLHRLLTGRCDAITLATYCGLMLGTVLLYLGLLAIMPVSGCCCGNLG